MNAGPCCRRIGFTLLLAAECSALARLAGAAALVTAPYARPFALRNAPATAAGDCLSIATALFMARIAAVVSFAETALTTFEKPAAGIASSRS